MHKDTQIQIRGSFLKITPSSHEEYKRLLTLTDFENWEYYTYNPMVTKEAKYCLKGLPTRTGEEDILNALLDEGITIKNVRQMTKSTLTNEKISQNFIPVWVLTADQSQETRQKLLTLTGILHFKVKIEDLRRKDSAIQCLRCQGFGHKAPFCRLTRKCRLCAELHDTRLCPNKERPPKCASCGGGHPASSTDCPTKTKYMKTMTKQTKTTIPTSTDFPALPTNPQPPPPPPQNAWKPKQTHIPAPLASSSIFDLLNLLNNPALQNIISLLTSFLQKLASSPTALNTITNLLHSANTFIN